MAALTNLGSGTGFIYVTDTNGVDVISSIKNNMPNVRKLILDASVSVALPPNTGTYAPGYGRRYFLNSGGGAVQGDLTGATEITQNIIQRGLEGQFPVNNYTIASGVVTVTRDAVITVVNIDTEGSAASDTLDTITTTDYNTGDIIIFRGVSASRVTTFSDGTGNLKLANNVNFLTGPVESAIAMQYVAGQGFVELWRTPSISISTASFRAAGLPFPIMGVEILTMPTSGTINIEPGNVNSINQIIVGSPTLIGSVVYRPNPTPSTPYKDGDELIITYNATPTTGVNTVTICGITLTATQAAQGRVTVRSIYDLGLTTWFSEIYYRAESVDVTNKAYVDATFEPQLGNPASDGFILSSTTGGVRSWIPAPEGIVVQTEITIPSADVLTLFTTPYDLIASPGAGFAIVINKAIAKIKTYGGAAYENYTTINLLYEGSSTINSFNGFLANTSVIQKLPSNSACMGIHQASNAIAENKKIQAQTPSGNPVTGNSDIVIWLEYQIISI